MAHSTPTTVFARRHTTAPTGLRISGFQRAGMLDWPGRVAATVFLGGCNLRCPFCHNPDLVTGGRRSESADALLAHLHERRDWLDGVVITGGEPCCEPRLLDLLRTLKAQNMPIKLDTNGTVPEVLGSAIAQNLVDFVALDVKTVPERYGRVTGVDGVWDSVSASIALVLGSDVDHEFRTTCYPPAVGPNDLAHIAALLAGGKRYVLQQYRPLRTLDPAATSVRPHQPETLRSAALRCSTFIPTIVRGT